PLAIMGDHQPPNTGHPLRPGASPRDIRAALLPEDQAKFDSEYDLALAGTRASLDLTELFKTLEQWRRIAVMQQDPQEFRRTVRRAAELLTNESIPTDEPPAVTRAKAGM